MDRAMRPVPSPVGSLLVGFYGWVVSALFGAVLLDIVYASTMRGVFDTAEAAPVFSAASDLLLFLVGLAVLAAIGAIASAWQSIQARNLLVASVLVIVAELFAPIVLRPLLLESNAGTWVRLLGSGSASVLGLLGLNRFYVWS